MELLGPEPLIAEKWIPYIVEVSVIVARTATGATSVFPMFTNSHSNHILDVTSCPADPSLLSVAAHAESIAMSVADSLELEGVLCVEFFVCEGGELMINEIAPRTHNSGHLTMEACRTSQFEQQVRAICNLPLGDTSLDSASSHGELAWGRLGQWFAALRASFAEPRDLPASLWQKRPPARTQDGAFDQSCRPLLPTRPAKSSH